MAKTLSTKSSKESLFVVLNKNASLANKFKTAANDNISYGKLHKPTLNSNLKKKES